MLEFIFTGGQTGADQAAWRAARSCGILTGGAMPAGFRTAAGDRPDLAAEYGATEHPSRDWPPRTEANVAAADATLILNRGPAHSPGTALAVSLCRRLGKPYVVVDPSAPPPPIAVAGRIAAAGYKVLNVGGNREPDPWEWAETYLRIVFGLLALTGGAKWDHPAPGLAAMGLRAGIEVRTPGP